jgi:hypothetical protein
MNPRHLALLFCVSLTISGCATGKKLAEDKKKAPEPPKLVGRVMSKPSRKNFVLIEYYGVWKFEDGTELKSSTEGRSACLIVSGERLGPYVAADVESGTVDVGDAVFHHNTKLEESETDLLNPMQTQVDEPAETSNSILETPAAEHQNP